MIRRALAALCVLGLTGCGLGAGEAREAGAELRVTRDFGHVVVASAQRDTLRDGDTVMRFLQSSAEVETSQGGRFVESIAGFASSQELGRRDWFFWVNGIEASTGAAERRLEDGDRVQWDYRRWDAAMRVPAIVGAFPEPFVSGEMGKRFPVRVECEDSEWDACNEVKERLSRAGAKPAGSKLGVVAGENVLRVIVATFDAVDEIRAARLVARGPEFSGVFARFTEDGRLDLLDERGRTVRSAPAGSGLVAATRSADEGVVWLLLGADERAVDAAVAAFDEASLRDAFAVAATPEGVVKLPVVETDGA